MPFLLNNVKYIMALATLRASQVFEKRSGQRFVTFEEVHFVTTERFCHDRRMAVTADGAAAVPARPRPGWALAARAARLAGCHRPAGRRMRSERSDLRLLSGGAQLCLWRMSCPSRAEARSSSSSGCAFVWKRTMRSGRVPGCGLEPAPRTLSPRNRVCTFYLSGIRRPSAADQRPPGCKPGARMERPLACKPGAKTR